MGRPRKRLPPPDAEPITCRKCNQVRDPADFYWKPSGGVQAYVCRACFYYTPTAKKFVDCGWCQTRFESGYAKAQFCSRECKGLARHRDRQAVINAAKPERKCPTCGVSLTPKHRADAVFCSVACSDKAHTVTRKIRRRIGEAGPRPRKVKLVSLAYIAERDGYRCGICGGKVAMTRRHPDPLAASIDHIVPLAAGGTNELANLQLSHFRCNWAKGDRGGGEQLRIVG